MNKNEAENITEKDKPVANVVIYPPRSCWKEFVLTFFTFSFSAPFWLVARVREVKALSGEKFTPWLWFFVPVTVLAQLIALPKLLGTMDALGQKNGVKPFGLIKAVIVLLIVVCTAYFQISDKYELHFGFTFIALTLYSLAIAMIQHCVNQMKSSLKEVETREIRYVYRHWEWAFLGLGAPFTIFIFYILVVSPMLLTVDNLNKGTVISPEGERYEMTIMDDGWHTLEIGANSDGSANLEIGGPLVNMNYMVFSHGFGSDMNSISYGRQLEILEDNADFKCSHERSFNFQATSVEAIIICKGKDLVREPAVYVSKVISTDAGIYELYGYFSSAKLSYTEHESGFISIAKGFHEK